jgi:hypothetical protein
VQPIVRLASCLISKADVVAEVDVAGRVVPYAAPVVLGEPARAAVRGPFVTPAVVRGATVEVPLLRLAHGRSGDKGDISNIGVLARKREFLPVLAAALTPEAVRAYLAHLVHGPVHRYDWPGLNGFNFVLRGALGGGGIASLRYDPQGKSYAQILMDFPIAVPTEWTLPEGLLGS